MKRARRWTAAVVALTLLAQPLTAAPGGSWGIGGALGRLFDDVVGLFTSSSASAGPPTYPSVVGADNPLVYYRLDESSGSTAHDSSGNNQSLTYGTHAVLGQTGLIAGDSDTAASDSTEALATGSPSNMPTGNAARTLEIWFATTSTPSYTGVITEGDFELVLDAGNTRIYYSGGNFETPGVDYYDGNPHLWDLTFDGSTIKVYFDGVEIARQAATMTTGANPALTLSAYPSATFDEAAVYGTALSATRVNAHWTRGGSSVQSCAPTPTSAYAQAVLADHPGVYYRLDENPATTSVAFDSSGNCNTASTAAP
jgi:hypothetical protein